MLLATLVPMGLFVLALGGCKAAPTALEQRFFTVVTNYVPVVVTNTVFVTNTVTAVLTNSTGAVWSTTNISVSATPSIGTNWAAAYDFRPNASAAELGTVGKAIGDPFGAGGIVELVLGGAFALWGIVRSNRAAKTSAALAQIIEVGRNVLATTPQGAALEEQWVSWMTKHQKERGVVTDVVRLLENTMDPLEARTQAKKLAELVAAG